MAKFAEHLFSNEGDRKQYEEICFIRRQEWSKHVESMYIPDEIKAFREEIINRQVADVIARNPGMDMTRLSIEQAQMLENAKKVGVWCNRVDPIVALMVVRYGEAVAHWPDEFTQDDIDRAKTWLEGKLPEAVIEANKHGV